MNRSLRLPLAVSVIGHGGVIALLVLLLGTVPLAPLPTPEPTPGIVVTLAPSEPIPKPPPLPPIPEIPPPPEPPPPPVPPPPTAEAPPPPVVRPQRPVIVHKPARRPVVRRPAREETLPTTPSVAPPVPTATAPALPPPAARAAPLISAAYRAELSAWLQSHKQYPENARARGEEGQVMLRFRVARSGQVLNYAVVQSSGYPDLDAAVNAMMRSAILPPFPADMAATDIQVTVGVRFALTR